MKILRLALITAVAGMLVVLMTGVPADASVSQGYVSGVGTITNDWSDEGPISATDHPKSGAVGMWQLVLWADGATEENGTAFDHADMDCDFGANTTYATKSWQRAHDLSADGVVGTNTLTAAEKHLTFDSDGGDVNYHGSAHTVYIGVRDVNGNLGGILGEYYIDSNCCEGSLYEATYAPLNQKTQGFCGS